MTTMLVCRHRALFRPLANVAILVLSTAACGKIVPAASDAGGDAVIGFEIDATAPATDASGHPADGQAADAFTSSVALVQQAIASTTQGSTISATLTNPTAVGNLLVVFGASAGGPLTGVTGGGVSQWILATASPTNANTEIWYGIVTTASRSAVAITYAGTADLRLDVTEWSGLVASQDVLDLAASKDGKTTTASTQPITTRAADLIIFGAAASGPTGTFRDPSDGPWTALIPITISGTNTQASGYQARPAAAQLQPTVAVPGTAWDTSIATFKIAPVR